MHAQRQAVVAVRHAILHGRQYRPLHVSCNQVSQARLYQMMKTSAGHDE